MNSLLQDARRSCIHLCIRALNRPAGFQPPDGSQPPGVSKRQAVIPRAHNGLNANRHSYVEGVPHGNAVKARRRYAHNLKRISLQGQAFADDSAIAPKVALPERKADVRSADAAARLVIGWPKEAPQERLNAKHMKKLAADTQGFGVMDLAASGQIEHLAAPNRNLRKSLLAVADLLPHREGELGILA